MYGADLHSKVKSCVRTVHTLPLEAEELLATGCPVDMEVSANVVDVVPVLSLVHKGGQHVQLIERTVYAPQVDEAIVVQMRARPPRAKTKRGGSTLPTSPHRRITPNLSSRCILVETKDSCAGERTWYRTGGSTRGFTSHWGFLIVQLSIVGVFPHRGRSLHSPSGESFPTGGGHRTAHLGSPSPPEDEIILFSTGGVFPHRGSPTSHMGGLSHSGRPLHSPLGESPSLKMLSSPNGLCKHGIRPPSHIPMKVRGAPPRSNRKYPPYLFQRFNQPIHSLTPLPSGGVLPPTGDHFTPH